MATMLQQLRRSCFNSRQTSRCPAHIHAGRAANFKHCQAVPQSHGVRAQTSSRSRQLPVMCKRRGDNSWNGSRSSRKADKSFRFKFNQVDVALAEDQMWRLVLPFAALFGVAVFIGPLVVGITLSAVAVGAAFSAGALAFTTLLLPLIVLSGIGGLMSFGVMAAVGAAFVIPKMVFSMLSLAFVGGGLLLGWGGVSWLLSQQATATDDSTRRSGSSSSSAKDDVDEDDGAEDVRKIASELREFDELLARSEEQRRVH